MRTRFAALLAFFAFILSMVPAAQAGRAPIAAAIGNSVVVLGGPWAFHPGDDMAWAQPDFDDSAWPTQDLTPPPDSIDPAVGSSGYVPGWTAKGFPHLVHFAWYRLRVNIRHDPSAAGPPQLALKMPDNLDDAYQIYVNGQWIGEFGRFSSRGVTFYTAQPRAFVLPESAATGTITIAIRMWMDAATPYQSPDAGGLHAPPLLGSAPAIDAMLRLDWVDLDRSFLVVIARAVFVVLMSILGFTLFWFDRRELAYLWLGMSCTFIVLNGVLNLVGSYSTSLGAVPGNILSDVILSPLLFGCWVIFWGYWFGFTGMQWIHRITWTLSALIALATLLLRAPLYGPVVPVAAGGWLFPLIVGLKVLIGLLVFWIAWRGIRGGGGDGWLALPALLCMPLWLYYDELALLHLPWNLRIFGIIISLGQIATFLTLVVVSVLMLRRFLRGLRAKQQLETEVEQARQVQQVLVPEALPQVPGFTVESEYRPAQQVGGDFFQVLPTEEGGLLAVIGDVSGKGMPAAMTVALLVGTIRTEAHHTHSPAKLLAMMNTRVLRRSQGGFTTCLIVWLGADGRATAANAGHLPAYLNGREMAVANSLPLGLSVGAEYGETTFEVHPGDRLTLITDGVVEACNAHGELLGFERAADLVRQDHPAGQIADAAQQFGQQDDITVVRIQRAGEDHAAGAVARMAAQTGGAA